MLHGSFLRVGTSNFLDGKSPPAVLHGTRYCCCVTSSPGSLIAYAWWCRCIYLLIRSICIRQIDFLYIYIYPDIRGNTCLENIGRELERYRSSYDIPHRPLISLYHQYYNLQWGWKAFQRAWVVKALTASLESTAEGYMLRQGQQWQVWQTGWKSGAHLAISLLDMNSRAFEGQW